jgi:dTDP-4-dehydrorhamnose reductase
MRVLITGGQGQLAADLRKVLSDHELHAPSRAELDITDRTQVTVAFDEFSPQLVINTAAYHNVDQCESEPELSFLVNAAAPQRLAALCTKCDAKLVHFSTDYVFDGSSNSPYRENEPANPINVYGTSKLAGELTIRSTLPNHLIIRTTGLYGWRGTARERGNFPEKMIQLATTRDVVTVVQDQVLTPSFTVDVAEVVRKLVEMGATGTIHVTNSGQCSWYEFAAELFRLMKLPARLEPISQEQWAMPARRPPYSVLAHRALQRLGIDEPRSWQDALAAYVAGRDMAARGQVVA